MIYKVKSPEKAWSILHNAFNSYGGPLEVSFDVGVDVDPMKIPINILRCTKCDLRSGETLYDVKVGGRASKCSACGSTSLNVITSVEVIIQGMVVLFRKYT